MERGRRTRCYYRDIVQVFSVSIQLKDQPIFDFPLSLTIGDTGSRLSPLSLQNQLLSPLPRWSNQDKTVKLYGTIKIISQGFHEELLFEQDKQKPLAINSGDAIPLIFGSEVCIPCLDFFLYTQLYEADHNHEISRGHFSNSMDYGPRYAVGTPLLQVFSVTITKDDKSERCSKICGAICVTDEHDKRFALYERDLRNPETINHLNGALTLAGPSEGISALKPFTIHVDLTSVAQDLEINRIICWNPKDTFYYDKLLSIDVPGKRGYATISCAIFSVAKAAEVEIFLSREVRMDGESNIEIYGTLVAYCVKNFDNSLSGDSINFESVLFNQSAKNCVNIKLGEAIPLLRSVVTFPARSSLVVKGKLYLSGTTHAILDLSTPEIVPANFLGTKVVGGGFVANVDVNWGCPVGGVELW